MSTEQGPYPPPNQMNGTGFDTSANSRPAKLKRRRRRTLIIGLSVTALTAGAVVAVVASRQHDPDYAQVCVDDQGNRVVDAQCGSEAGRGSGIYHWYFYPIGRSIPPIGGSTRSYPGYQENRPSSGTSRPGFKSSGGTVNRGGFGGKSSGSGG